MTSSHKPTVLSQLAVSLACLAIGFMAGRVAHDDAPMAGAGASRSATQLHGPSAPRWEPPPLVPSYPAALGAASSPSIVTAPTADRPESPLEAASLRLSAQRLVNSEAFAKQQIAVTSVNCGQDGTCRFELQLPPFASAAQERDAGIAADLLAGLKTLPKYRGREIGLTHVSFGKDGASVGFSVGKEQGQTGRYYTATEIAQLRLQTIEEYIKQRGVKP